MIDSQLAITDRSSGRIPFEVPNPPPGAFPLNPPPPVALTVATSPAPTNQAGWNSGLVARAVRRYWMFIILIGAAVGSGLAAAVWTLLPPGRQPACVVLHIS